MRIDYFSTPYALQRFEELQAAIPPVLEGLRLGPARTVLMGTAALTLHGINAHVKQFNNPFDVDALIDEPALEELQQYDTEGLTDGRVVIVPALPGRNELTFTGLVDTDLRIDGQPYSFDELCGIADVTPSGLLTVPFDMLIREKSVTARPKDLAGMLQAQVMAHATGHPAIETVIWQENMADIVMKTIIARDEWHQKKTDVFSGIAGGWVHELVDAGFAHPAFDDANLIVDRRLKR